MHGNSGSTRSHSSNNALLIHSGNGGISRGIRHAVFAIHALYLQCKGVSSRLERDVGMAGTDIFLILFGLVRIAVSIRLVTVSIRLVTVGIGLVAFCAVILGVILSIFALSLILIVRDLGLFRVILSVIRSIIRRLIDLILIVLTVAAVISAALAGGNRKQHRQRQQKYHQFFHVFCSSKIFLVPHP